MKVEILTDGYIHIIAETAVEAYALMHLSPPETPRCSKCDQMTHFPVVIDCAVLSDQDKP